MSRIYKEQKIITLRGSDGTQETFPVILAISDARRSLSITIDEEGQVMVRMPILLSEGEALRYLEEHADWVLEHRREQMEKAAKKPVSDLTPKEREEKIRFLAMKMRPVLVQRIAYYEPMLPRNHRPITRITIRSQKTRWGSCSSKGGLNFNWRLYLAPPEILDYVVVHELCHLVEMNHSKAFWDLVGSILPDYKEREQWLKDNGSSLDI